MNYEKHYYTLINRAKSRLIEGYVEKHHILPKCCGGSDDLDNIVILTPEEHYVAHLLLIKIYPDNLGLLYAAKMMCVKSDKHQRNNKLYGWLKRKYSVSLTGVKRKQYNKSGKPRKVYTKSGQPRKVRAKETKPRKKRTLTEEHKKKIGLASLGRTKSKETKQLISTNSSSALQKKKAELGYVRSYTPKRTIP